MNWGLSVILVWLSSLCPAFTQIDSNGCLYEGYEVLRNYFPKDKADAGVYTRVKEPIDLKSCVYRCCRDPMCDLVFMHNTTCFTVACTSLASCKPVRDPNVTFTSMVIVRQNRFNGDDALDQDDMAMDASDQDPVKSCEPSGCGDNALCISDVCECMAGFQKSSNGECIAINASSPQYRVAGSTLFESKDVPEPSRTSTSTPLKKVEPIIVNVMNKTLRLPDNEVKLVAYTVPTVPPGQETHYSFKWTPVSRPEGSGETVSQTDGSSLTLSHLTEGLYTFKVTVTAPGAYGETEANVSVLPQQRDNVVPTAIVTPSRQIVKLPNSLAVLDASSSKDDSGIEKYHWELQQGPLGYQPNLADTQTLQLTDLKKPGNYSFKLTVTDTDGATNSTQANITVLQVPDYPPQANAGSSIVLYLPRNNVTLNGNLSADDRGIASWEWTKSASDQDKAVDMQNTHTPYLQLSHLEEGMYTFVLKVTDDSGQSSSSDVYVFVKPPTNKPPLAHAGSNQSIALPQTWVILNGSLSSDDIGIDHWTWEQISGPRPAVFVSPNSSITNVTGLTKGEYLFKLTVVDGNDNSVSSNVAVVVTQNKNQRPKANAGGDQTLSLPLSVLVVNGSLSSDDLGIAKWQWTREPTSLAIGDMLEQTDTSPVLMVTNVVAGRYEFRLRVSDDQGEWNEDTVSIILKPDPELLNLVELTLNIEAGKLTQTQRDSVLLKLGMLLRDASQIIVRNLRVDASGRSTLIFYVTGPSGSIPGPSVVHTLKNKLAQDSFLLQLSVVDIRTTVCQNNCSGHGVCDQETRICFCEAFWMQDLIRKHLGDGESNCGWSILYVIIGLLILSVLTVGCVWGVICLCHRLFAPSPKEKTRYALLENTEQVRLPVRDIVLSDSETDSDVLFENKGKSNGIKAFRNGFKPERRIKT